MGLVHSESVTVTTAADGTATVYTDAVNGKITDVIYTKDDFANGVDFTITTATTGQNIWVDTDINASETVRPRSAVHSTAGAATYYNDENDNPVLDYIRAAEERIKIVIGSGGDTKSGTFTVVVER